jgi:hypothetical protein
LENVQFCPRSRKTKILTTGIHVVFRGLKFKSEAEIGQKGVFFKGLEKEFQWKNNRPHFSGERWGFLFLVREVVRGGFIKKQ